jgi:enoyl-CoA hydratase
MTNYKNLLIEIKDHILTITINRESKMNALNRETLGEIDSAIKGASQDKEVRGIIITGSGSKSFIAGADISEFLSLDHDKGAALASEGHNVFSRIENCEKPVIAAINGYALGGGLELAMACHLRIAAGTAQLGLPEITLGLIPGYGGTQRLTHLVGKSKALEMILISERIGAQEAFETGLVNHVVPEEELISKAEELMRKIIKGSPLALAGAIRAVNSALIEGEDGFKTEINEFAKCFKTEDFKEGARAFIEKRKPVFRGK